MLTLENRASVRVDRGFKGAKELQVQFGSTVAYQRVLGSQGFSSFEHNIHTAVARVAKALNLNGICARDAWCCDDYQHQHCCRRAEPVQD